MVGYTFAFTVLVAALNLISHPILAKVAVGASRVSSTGRLARCSAAIEAVLMISAAIVILDTYFGTTGAPRNEPGLGFLKTASQAARQLDDRPVPDPHDGAVRAGASSARCCPRTSARSSRPRSRLPDCRGCTCPSPDDRQGTVAQGTASPPGPMLDSPGLENRRPEGSPDRGGPSLDDGPRRPRPAPRPHPARASPRRRPRRVQRPRRRSTRTSCSRSSCGWSPIATRRPTASRRRSSRRSAT